jgi:hypothetical protein
VKATPYTAAQAAFAASTTAGRLLGVQVTTTGTTTGAAITIYDNASAASGTILFTAYGSGGTVTSIDISPTWKPAGPPNVGIPYSNGLWVVSTASTGGAGVVVFSEGVPNDGRPAT